MEAASTPATTANTKLEKSVAPDSEELSPGCDLWIMAAPAQSTWARRLDWYLNYQVMKAELHQAKELSKDLREILIDAELPLSPASPGERLMIASATLLPNRQTVLIQHRESAASWAKSCHEVWIQLGQPSLRVFLPDQMSKTEFLQAWPVKEPVARLDLVGAP